MPDINALSRSLALAEAVSTGLPVPLGNPDGTGMLFAFPTGVVGYGQPRVQPPLKQANPYTTYVSPNTPQPAGTLPVLGQTGTQSGPPVHATYDMPPAPPDLHTQARDYRTKHGLATQDDTDALNAESLAAAQSGRTYLDQTLAAQYGQPLPSGVSGPRTDVVNALIRPPTGQGTYS
ncbi:MAG TPA: hypothetical protein VGH84_00615 [Steroidobacteraceae bacterium]|jgi:hypothetical protein